MSSSQVRVHNLNLKVAPKLAQYGLSAISAMAALDFRPSVSTLRVPRIRWLQKKAIWVIKGDPLLDISSTRGPCYSAFWQKAQRVFLALWAFCQKAATSLLLCSLCAPFTKPVSLNSDGADTPGQQSCSFLLLTPHIYNRPGIFEL